MEDKYIITLDNDDKYVIVSKIEYNNETYCYLGKLDNDIKYFYGKIINCVLLSNGWIGISYF